VAVSSRLIAVPIREHVSSVTTTVLCRLEGPVTGVVEQIAVNFFELGKVKRVDTWCFRHYERKVFEMCNKLCDCGAVKPKH